MIKCKIVAVDSAGLYSQCGFNVSMDYQDDLEFNPMLLCNHSEEFDNNFTKLLKSVKDKSPYLNVYECIWDGLNECQDDFNSMKRRLDWLPL